MQTLTEIENEEYARRERARVYQTLTGEAERLRGVLAGLHTAALDMSALRQIFDLIALVPKELITSGRSSSLAYSIPGNLVARDVLMSVAGDAIALAERREQKRQDALADAESRLAEVERALAQFK